LYLINPFQQCLQQQFQQAVRVATQYASAPLQVDNIFVFIRQVAVLFRHVGYLRPQQQVDL